MGTAAGLLLSVASGYLLGSVPSGFLVGKTLAGVDVRSQGSGMTGATNVRRLLGWRAFFLVMLLDVLKGVVAVLIAGWLIDAHEPWAKAAAGLAAVVGHSWPAFLGFKGGRGVATGMGAMLAMLPQVIVVVAIIAVPLILLSRYISLGSVAGAALVPVLTLVVVLVFHEPWPYFLYALIAAGLVVLKHRDNIGRLISGTERRI